MTTDFAVFYSAVHGRAPFPWQQRLAAYVLEQGAWPERISVPTACGKTSVLDVALFALAAQADRGPARSAPMRIFFVVDRRLVVDDVTAHAHRIQGAIDKPTHEITEWVRAQLEKYGSRHPLAVATLRGGMYRSDTWVEEPNQPLICASTVDQVGSRLLFRGYGVSDSRRPVDAGLTGNDSLIILDEAHLSNPFLTTVRSVREYQGQSQGCRSVQLVEMSATVREHSNASPSIMLSSEDLASPLRDRLSREKRVLLKEVASLESAAVEEAVHLQAAGAPVVGIVMNTVAVARAVFEQLPAACNKILLTGRIRPFDRDALLSQYLDRMKAGRSATDPLIVVATQTIEAGADLDFDALVSELAPLDCLIQRFGRLNRIGRRERAAGVILRPKRAREGIGIYRDSPENTWQWLLRHATNGELDFCASALRDILKPETTVGCISPADNAPLLLPAHLDAWVQTNPAPAEDPDVAPFLHGPSTSAEVQIVWRADLPKDNPGNWTAILTSVPPLSSEALPLSLRASRQWLRNESAAPITDIEADILDTEERAPAARSFLIWRGPDNSIASTERNSLYKLRAGDTIVVHSSEGGCDSFGWNPASKTHVPDIGDKCNNERARQGRGKYRLRLFPEILYSAELFEQRDNLQALLVGFRDEDAESEGGLRTLVAEYFPWSEGLGPLRPYGNQSILWISKGFHKEKPISPDGSPDESDENDSSSFTVAVTLEDHTAAVVAKAAKYAGICTTERAHAAILHAAHMHDLGKLDDRFQIALGAGVIPLAKSGTDPSEYSLALRRAGYPKGGRHEFASVLIAEQIPVPPDCDRQLALHLIGTHHGQGRSMVPFWCDPEDPEIRVPIGGKDFAVRGAHRRAQLDSGWIDQFWKLNRTYGWWGLAFFEAILRRADCVVSREEQEIPNG